MRYAFSLVVLSCLCIGCGPTSTEETSPEIQEENQTTPTPTTPTPSELDSEAPGIPTHTGVSNCTEIPDKVSLCDWMARSQAIVVAKIITLKTSDAPAITTDGTKTITDQCNASVDAALVIGIEVETVIQGNLGAGQQLQVHIGTGLLSHWGPTLRKDNQNQYRWTGPGGLAVGQRLGIPLSYNDSLQQWSNRNELLFALRENDSLSLQEYQIDSCDVIAPEGLELEDISSLKMKAQACPADSQTTQQFLEHWNSNPAYFSLAQCHGSAP